jgi:hypothetical protein
VVRGASVDGLAAALAGAGVVVDGASLSAAPIELELDGALELRLGR